MKQVLFFATPDDIRPIIASLQGANAVSFVRIGNHEVKAPPVLSGDQIPDPGIATHETASGSISYMIIPAGAKPKVNQYKSEDTDTPGRTMWSVYSGFNEDSVEITLAGLWEDGTLLSGSMKTMHKGAFSQKIMRDFQSALKKAKFEKVQSWWLGAEALDMLKAGKRLTTTAVQSPPDYDLRPEHIDA